MRVCLAILVVISVHFLLLPVYYFSSVICLLFCVVYVLYASASLVNGGSQSCAQQAARSTNAGIQSIADFYGKLLADCQGKVEASRDAER